MNLEVPKICEDDGVVVVEEFTLEDFRTISFLIENNSDNELYKFLISKIKTDCNSYDKINALIHARIQFVNEIIKFNNGSSNISVSLKSWSEIFIKSYKDIKTTITDGGYSLELNYPNNFLFYTLQDVIIDCIDSLDFKNRHLDFKRLDKTEKTLILDKLPSSIITKITSYIDENFEDIVIMQPKLGLSRVTMNLFDNSSFNLIKTIYNYYTYEDILEIIFMISNKISDIQYINSRTPRDLDFLIRLYSEEVAKSNQEDKLHI